MTNSTSEREQRLKMIRYRAENYLTGTVHAETYHQDVNLLLSMLDSQAAERVKRRAPYSEECRAAIGEVERRFESENVELCSIEYVHQREDHTATAMRDKCFEKVRAIHEERLRDLRTLVEKGEIEHEDAEYERAVLFVLSNVITAIQSLTLDQVDQEKQQS